ncbi:hypothetical protein UB33_10630 [Photobacterium angustum]|uniref:hypothetical protein n=1 Tax=Photobacterium angustum TaxID=661 RepID=UPI0005E2D06E|nr:hypothetical protein [Photobacterium angustum]KJG06106.1 hypothetical protein UB33_10630 [Photobacterium angustum]PSV88516.1 hypothetical protein CTN01_19860 [Photobacterium angustum]
MKILSVIVLLCLATCAQASLYFGPPDGENIIDVADQGGYLFKVEKGIYIQTDSEEFLLGISTLFENLKHTRTGKAIIKQVSHYQPLSLPQGDRALAFKSLGQNAATMEKIHVVIRPSQSGKQFVTEPLITSSRFMGHQSNGLGVPAAIYFDIENTVMLPGLDVAIDPTIALGHELIHARDYLTGGLPVGTQPVRHRAPIAGMNHQGEAFTEGEVIEFNLMRREIEATGLAYQKGNLSLKTLTTTREAAIDRRQSIMSVWEQAIKNHRVSKAEYGRVKTNIQLLKSEMPVSEYHLSMELGAHARDMYWPGSMINYTSTPTNITLKQARQSSAALSRSGLNTVIISDVLSRSPQSPMVISTSLIEIKNGFPKLDKVLRSALELAAKSEQHVVLLKGDEFSSLSEFEQRLTITTLEKALVSIRKNQYALTVIEMNVTGLIGTGQEIVAKANQIILLSTHHDLSSLALSEYISARGKRLVVNRISRSILPSESLLYPNRLRWSALAEQDNVTLVANSALPKSKKCWSL